MVTGGPGSTGIRLLGAACRVHRLPMENERVHDEQLEIGDAFGDVLLACQKAGGAPGVAFELIERSDGFLAVGDVARYFSADPDLAIDLAAGRVLDIGAGAGRASVALQDRGHDVVALDISPGATAVCEARGVRTTFTGSVFDLAASRPDPFDTFLMLGNNLGLLGDPAQAGLLLEALGAMSAPGARVVGETADPYVTTDPLHLDYHEQNRRAGRLPGQLRLRVRHRRMVTPWWDYLFCTPAEQMARRLRTAPARRPAYGLSEPLPHADLEHRTYTTRSYSAATWCDSRSLVGVAICGKSRKAVE